MKLVIDIHEKDYHSVMYSNHVPYGVVYAIKNCTPLTEWLNSFDTSSPTKCFEAVNILKQRLEENT